MVDFRDSCNFLTFGFSEKLFWLSRALVCWSQKCTFRLDSSSLTVKDHLITTATLGSFLINFCWTKNHSYRIAESKTNQLRYRNNSSFAIHDYNTNSARWLLYFTSTASILHIIHASVYYIRFVDHILNDLSANIIVTQIVIQYQNFHCYTSFRAAKIYIVSSSKATVNKSSHDQLRMDRNIESIMSFVCWLMYIMYLVQKQDTHAVVLSKRHYERHQYICK